MKKVYYIAFFIMPIIIILVSCSYSDISIIGIKIGNIYQDAINVFENSGENVGSGNFIPRWKLSHYVDLKLLLEQTSDTNSTNIENCKISDIWLTPGIRGKALQPYFHLDSKSDYDNFVSQNSAPIDFISYENLKSFGQFISLISYSFYNSETFSDMVYRLTDENGYLYNVYIDKGIIKTSDCCKIAKKIELPDNNLQTCKEKGVCYAEINNAEYTYIDGKLSSISWTNGNKTIAVVRNGELNSDFPEAMFSDYPTNGKETVLSRLLSKKTAPDMIKKLSDSKFFE